MEHCFYVNTWFELCFFDPFRVAFTFLLIEGVYMFMPSMFIKFDDFLYIRQSSINSTTVPAQTNTKCFFLSSLSVLCMRQRQCDLWICEFECVIPSTLRSNIDDNSLKQQNKKTIIQFFFCIFCLDFVFLFVSFSLVSFSNRTEVLREVFFVSGA